jgi:hypothetical protein
MRRLLLICVCAINVARLSAADDRLLEWMDRIAQQQLSHREAAIAKSERDCILFFSEPEQSFEIHDLLASEQALGEARPIVRNQGKGPSGSLSLGAPDSAASTLVTPKLHRDMSSEAASLGMLAA